MLFSILDRATSIPRVWYGQDVASFKLRARKICLCLYAARSSLGSGVQHIDHLVSDGFEGLSDP